jgi:hypothetical protein
MMPKIYFNFLHNIYEPFPVAKLGCEIILFQIWKEKVENLLNNYIF